MESISRRSSAACVPDSRLRAIVEAEFPVSKDGITYLNTGSAGRKPQSVVEALNQALLKLNYNPTMLTFLDNEPISTARELAAKLLSVDPANLLLTGNSTQGLQLLLQSFLTKSGDELVTTNHEHGSTKTIVRYLEETRGIVVRKYDVPPRCSSQEFTFGILSLVNEKTKLVMVSEIDCFTGWRPDLSTLADGLELLFVPFLVDGAHSPGHVVTRPANFPLWVGSGHKWLGGPNGTGFTYVSKELIPHLEPVWLGDQFYDRRDQDIYDITRFECKGTSDVCAWFGLAAAIQLQLKLDADAVNTYQSALCSLLRNRLEERLPVEFRTPSPDHVPREERTAMLTFHFPGERVKVKDLREALYRDHKIWIQPDFLNANPGHGARISCHYSVQENDIERLVEALMGYID